MTIWTPLGNLLTNVCAATEASRPFASLFPVPPSAGPPSTNIGAGQIPGSEVFTPVLPAEGGSCTPFVDPRPEPEAPGRHRAPAAARRWIVSQAVRPSGMLKLRPDKGESGRDGGEAYPNLSGSF